jgi:hypothetical protein
MAHLMDSHYDGGQGFIAAPEPVEANGLFQWIVVIGKICPFHADAIDAEPVHQMLRQFDACSGQTFSNIVVFGQYMLCPEVGRVYRGGSGCQ